MNTTILKIIRFSALTLFVIVTALDCILVKKKGNRYLTKPLLMPLLLIFYLLNTRQINLFIVLALVFSFLGDVFLLITNKKNFFILGLLSFLMCHIFYTITFLQSVNYMKGIPSNVYLFLIPYLICGTFVYADLSKYLKSMKIPVIIYMGVILIMSFTALARYYYVSPISFVLPFIGSILFVVSDTLIAYRNFKQKVTSDNILIMLSYILAQLLIIVGIIL